MASPPVPALRVRSASSGVTALIRGPGPVNSEIVSGTSIRGSVGARRRVDWYASYRYGGKTSLSPRIIAPIVVCSISSPGFFNGESAFSMGQHAFSYCITSTCRLWPHLWSGNPFTLTLLSKEPQQRDQCHTCQNHC